MIRFVSVGFAIVDVEVLLSKEGYVSVGDTRLFYRREGEGIPLVFLHGFALEGRMWDNQVIEPEK